MRSKLLASTVAVGTILTCAIVGGIIVNGEGATAQETINQTKAINDVLDFKAQYVGAAEPRIEMIRAAELGPKQVEIEFHNAQWKFYPDGKFVFIPTQPEIPIKTQVFIVGTYTQVGSHLEIQGEQLQEIGGVSISIDGTIHKENNKLTLSLIYTYSSRNSQKIAKISQLLVPDDRLINQINVQQLIKTSELRLKLLNKRKKFQIIPYGELEELQQAYTTFF